MKRMSMTLGLLLAGCGGEGSDRAPDPGNPIAAAPKPGEPDGRIFCAPPGEAELRRMCAAERTEDARGTVLTVRLPDSGFHRLRVSADGRDIAAADGAAPAIVRTNGKVIEVEVGGARYRLPAAAGAGDASD
jgi:hypothetical protein